MFAHFCWLFLSCFLSRLIGFKLRFECDVRINTTLCVNEQQRCKNKDAADTALTVFERCTLTQRLHIKAASFLSCDSEPKEVQLLQVFRSTFFLSVEILLRTYYITCMCINCSIQRD